MQARDMGARGMIVVSGPTSGVKEQLVPLQFDGSLAGSGRNAEGQLNFPAAAKNLVAIAAGRYHSVVVKNVAWR